MKTGKTQTTSRWDKIMMAITFAEAGEHQTAKEMMREHTKKTLRAELDNRPKHIIRPDIRL